MSQERIFSIPEIEGMIFDYLDLLTDLKALTLVNHYYHNFINQYKMYDNLKTFCLNRKSYQEQLQWSIDDFTRACSIGNLTIAKYIHRKRHIRIHAGVYRALRWACNNDQLEVAKWLYDLDPVISTSFYEYYSSSYSQLKLSTTIWIYNLGISLSISKALQEKCLSGEFETVIWLCNLVNTEYNFYELSRLTYKQCDLEITIWLSMSNFDLFLNPIHYEYYPISNDLLIWLYCSDVHHRIKVRSLIRYVIDKHSTNNIRTLDTLRSIERLTLADIDDDLIKMAYSCGNFNVIEYFFEMGYRIQNLENVFGNDTIRFLAIINTYEPNRITMNSFSSTKQ